MTISKRQQLIVFYIWLLTVPLCVLVAYSYFPLREFEWTNVLLLFFVMFLTMLLPLRFKNVTISLERWITFAVFFQYGILAEFIFIQAATLILIVSDKSPLPVAHRFFANSTIFAVVSIVSGFIFHFFGGVVGSLDFSQVFPLGLLYAATYSLLNNIMLKIYFIFNRRTYSLYSKDALWDYLSTLIMVSLSISLYFLHVDLGNKSLLLVGIPFLVVLIILRMYSTSNTLNAQLKNAGEIGHELADRLLYDEVLETFLGKLKDIVPFEHAYVVSLQAEKKLIPLMSSEFGIITKEVKGISFREGKKIDDGLNERYSKIYFNEKEIRSLINIKFIHSVGTVVTVPIVHNQKTEGFLILTATRKNSFSTVNMQIIDVLAGYFAVSLEKARYFENTIAKSERCGLTNLHNFRYLDEKLNEWIIEFHLGDIEKLSVVILDIDYFKSINDTYGHESGNDLLVMFAGLLKKFKGPSDTLARYGGEEFVLVMPNCDKITASERAEQIRRKVEDTMFTIIPDLAENRSPVDVQMTISLGVATIPEDATSGQSVMRNADRALYIGGKQAGRNKVGVFQEQEIVEAKETRTIS